MSTSTPTTTTTTTGGGGGGGGGRPSITTNYFIGLSYAVTVGLGLLVLLSTIVLASYICCRPSRQRRNQQNPNTTTSTSNNRLILTSGIFVADDDGDDNAAVGIDPAVINSYPKFPFSKDHGGGVNDSTCSICLCEYRDAEMLRMLLDCRHYFHITCVDAWLKLNASCPVCRN